MKVKYRSISPKLRMIANGSFKVNQIRSELSSSIAVKADFDIEEKKIERSQFQSPAEWSEIQHKTERGLLKHLTPDINASVFVELLPVEESEEEEAIPGEIRRKNNIVTASLPLSRLEELEKKQSVLHIELGQTLQAPKPIIENANVKPPDPDEESFQTEELAPDGEGILIGCIDVQGFDFAHLDFLDQKGKTRFLYIWDQGGGQKPFRKGFPYGSEIKKEHMDEALRVAKEIGVPPQRLEPQSQMAPGSHGTHVASIAAGNRGICPKAYLVGVLIALSDENLDRRKSFYDSASIAHAVDYVLDVAKELETKLKKPVPVAINISLGTNGHAHDGSSACSRWIDSELTKPGRSVCVAAGNAGQESPVSEDDYGFIMGRIHTSGNIPAKGLTKDIEWIVVGNGIVDVSENELEIWYSPQDRFSVSVKPPGMDWIKPVKPGEFIENRQLPDGSFISIYNEFYYHSNGANYISLYLSPFFTEMGLVGIPAGKWLVRLYGEEVRDGSYHGWIERDDPRRTGRIGSKEAWSFPSFFSEISNVDNSSVSTLACGNLVLSVANMDTSAEKINITSSQGPTRDGRRKPEVAAPGTNITAAKGFSGPDDLWISMSGTSMASPYVCGVAGLMFSVEPTLTAAQIIGIIMHTSRPLPGYDYNWQNDAGFGLIDPAVCLREAGNVNRKEDKTDENNPVSIG